MLTQVASIEQVQEKTPLAPIIKHTISIDSTIQNLYGHPRLSLDIHDNGTCQAIGIYEARDLLEAITVALNIFEKS